MTKRFYAPKPNKAKGFKAAPIYTTAKCAASTSSPPLTPSACELVRYIRFVLISGAALELDASTLEEVTETWADKCCKAVCGLKADGVKVAIPVERVDYLEEITC